MSEDLVFDDDISSGGNTTTKPLPRKDGICYFLCGLVGDSLPGFFFSATVIKLLETPNDNVVVLALSANIGGLVGVLLASFVFVLTRLLPDI